MAHTPARWAEKDRWQAVERFRQRNHLTFYVKAGLSVTCFAATLAGWYVGQDGSCR
ncbi:hypothetical protein BDR03DRAFT_304314 [Suillus americanus]|nr:hypothetical protein BDR03DRAFT_304314 [Suillus americanus]